MIAFVISNYFLMYIMGSDAWFQLVTDHPANHIIGLTGMTVFAFVFYFIFSWFREQVCTIVCPYGRLQGVLLDRDSIVISYDTDRGEPRGFLRKGENRPEMQKGDCVDCNLCVAVCPTGIDIRNGTQLECINCACCIDACNSMMRKVGFRPGLIRYASEKMLAEKRKWHFTARSGFYTVVLAAILATFVYFIVTRNPVEATVLRSPGMLYQEQADGKISNLYNLKLVNKSSLDLPLRITLTDGIGEVQVIGARPVLKKQSLGEFVFFVMMDRKLVSNGKKEIGIAIFSGDRELDRTTATFVGPVNQ